jgi:peptide/nickel transport system ATP-binding protein
MVNTNVLEVHDLSMVYTTEGIDLPVLRNINLEIQVGQIYGLVGESGSGKTTLGLTIMRYLPPQGRVTKGMVKLASRDLLALPKSELQALWGKDITLVPQDPFSSLNPSIRIGEQLAELFRAHGKLDKKAARKRALDWIERVRLPDPQRIASKYPHELSGGQVQRIMVAMALSNQPQLLVLDEPTTSLDVTTEAVVLDLLRDLIQEEGASALFITHNLGIVAGLTDQVAVLYAGELVEDSPTKSLYRQPLHPYTQGLLNSVPQLGMHKDETALVGIVGQIPSLTELPPGCVFAQRCSLAIDLCLLERPPLEHPSQDRSIRCHRWREIQAGGITLIVEDKPAHSSPPQETEPILWVNDLQVIYQISSAGLGTLLGKKHAFQAVDGVSLQVGKSRTLGIVGESGSGKTSLALAIMGLVDSASGEMNLLKFHLPHELRKRDRKTLRLLQMVFQSQDEAFSPFLTVEEILSRPLRNLLGMQKDTAQERVVELLDMVRLPAEFARRYPQQLSGGEKQRVAIAQAFAANPNLLITDEPVSALDVSVQANILNLLNVLQRDHGTASLLISHDIAVVTYLADEVAVMYLGQFMQFSYTHQLLSPPFHPYTEALLSAVPVADPDHQLQSIRLPGDISSPLEKPAGCPFHTRCPRLVGDICMEEKPPWQSTPEGKQIFCHIPIKELLADQKALLIDKIGAGK